VKTSHILGGANAIIQLGQRGQVIHKGELIVGRPQAESILRPVDTQLQWGPLTYLHGHTYGVDEVPLHPIAKLMDLTVTGGVGGEIKVGIAQGPLLTLGDPAAEPQPIVALQFIAIGGQETLGQGLPLQGVASEDPLVLEVQMQAGHPVPLDAHAAITPPMILQAVERSRIEAQGHAQLARYHLLVLVAQDPEDTIVRVELDLLEVALREHLLVVGHICIADL